MTVLHSESAAAASAEKRKIESTMVEEYMSARTGNRQPNFQQLLQLQTQSRVTQSSCWLSGGSLAETAAETAAKVEEDTAALSIVTVKKKNENEKPKTTVGCDSLLFLAPE